MVQLLFAIRAYFFVIVKPQCRLSFLSIALLSSVPHIGRVKEQSSSRWWDRFLPASKADIRKILMKQADLQAALDALNAQLVKATGEITTEIQTLKDSLATVDLPQGATDSLTRLQGLAQALDDLNPDVASPALKV